VNELGTPKHFRDHAAQRGTPLPQSQPLLDAFDVSMSLIMWGDRKEAKFYR